MNCIFRYLFWKLFPFYSLEGRTIVRTSDLICLPTIYHFLSNLLYSSLYFNLTLFTFLISTIYILYHVFSSLFSLVFSPVSSSCLWWFKSPLPHIHIHTHTSFLSFDSICFSLSLLKIMVKVLVTICINSLVMLLISAIDYSNFPMFVFVLSLHGFYAYFFFCYLSPKKGRFSWTS